MMFFMFSGLKDSAKITGAKASRTCESNMQMISQSFAIYIQDHQGKYPNSNEIWQVVKVDPTALTCPAAGAAPGSITYGYNSFLSDSTLAGIYDTDSVPMFADGGNEQHLITGINDVANHTP